MSREISKILRELVLKGDLFVSAAALLLALTAYFFLQALVEGLITPIFAAVFDKPGLYALSFTVNGTEFGYGSVLTGLIVLIAAVALVISLAIVLRKVRPGAGTDAPTS